MDYSNGLGPPLSLVEKIADLTDRIAFFERAEGVLRRVTKASVALIVGGFGYLCVSIALGTEVNEGIMIFTMLGGWPLFLGCLWSWFLWYSTGYGPELASRRRQLKKLEAEYASMLAHGR